MSAEILLRVTGVAKSFEGMPVLRDLRLEVGCGEVYGLLGANGAGKTTAINIITGLLPADSGRVTLGQTGTVRARRALIGVAPQEVALYPRLSCGENVAFFGALYGWHGRRLAARLKEVIEVTRLRDYRNARVATLSGGTRRRLNLAVALVHNPALLILDEPTAGLDVAVRYAVWEVIRELRRSGTSVLLTTHLLDEAAGLCDRIGLLHDGRIEREGTLEELCAAIPAVQVAETESDDEEALVARAEAIGLATRRKAGRVALLLPELTSLDALVRELAGVSIRSIALRAVGLEDVFFELGY